MQLLHFTQIALYAFLKMYLFGGEMWLLCSHNEIRSKEAGPHFIYLIFYGLLSVIVFFFFLCGWRDDVVGDIWQTVLDALKLVVMCIYVGLWGSGLCKRGSRSISFRRRLSSEWMNWFGWNGTGTRSLVCINLLNRHVGGRPFCVTTTGRAKRLIEKNASGRRLSLGNLLYIY